MNTRISRPTDEYRQPIGSRRFLFPTLILLAVLIALWLVMGNGRSMNGPAGQQRPLTQAASSAPDAMIEAVIEQPSTLPPPAVSGGTFSSPNVGIESTIGREPSLRMPATFDGPVDRAGPSGDRNLNDGDWRKQFKSPPPQEPPVARATLTEIRPYQEWDVHQTAADSLGRIGTAAVPALVRILSDPDPKRRAEAAWLLGHIGPAAKQAVPALAAALNDPATSVQKTAARALGQIGPDAAEAVEALMQLVEQTEPIGVTVPDSTNTHASHSTAP